MGRLIFLVFAGFLATASAHGQSAYSWNVSSGSAGFTTAANWLVSGSPPAVSPGTLDDVTIGIAGTYTVTLATNATISTLTLNNATATFAQSAGTFSINNAFTFTNGIYNLTGGTLNLNGGMTMAAGTMTVNGGAATINLTGNLTLNGGAINLGSSTINGGTILTSGGLRVNNTSSNATLNNVTLGDGVNADVLRLNSGFTWRFQGTTDFRVGFAPVVTNLTNLHYLTTKTLTADITLQNANIESATAGQTITVGAGRSISRNGTGSGGSIQGAGNWINEGTIQVTGNGSQLSIGATGSFVNNGVILSQSSGSSAGIVSIQSSVLSFVNTGTLRTTGGSATSLLEIQKNVTTEQLGNWDTTAGGEVRLRNNTLTNTGDTLNITTARGPLYLSNAIITGGTVQADVGVRLTLSGSATLNNVTLGGGNGNLDVLNRGTGGTWSFQGSTDFQVGFTPTLFNLTNISFLTTRTLNTDYVMQDMSLFSGTAGQTITIDVGRSITRVQSGSGGGINGVGNWINNGTLQVTGNGSTMSIGGSGSFVNNGTMLAQSSGASPAFVSVLSSISSFSNTGILRATTNGFLTLQENMTTAQLGTWDTTGGGEVRIDQITLTNTGDTLNVTAARGPLYSQNATVLNGTIQADPGVRFSLSGSGGSGVTLNNVTLGGGNGNLDVLRLTAGGTWIFQGSTDFQAGFVPTFTNVTRLLYLNTRTLNTDFILANGVLLSQTAGQTITVGVGRTITASPGGTSSMQGSGNWINNGTIRTTGDGTAFNISNTGTFTNQGNIIAESTGASQSNYSLTPTTLSNYNAGTFTLTDGSYRALTRGTISSGAREFRNLAGNAFVELGLASSFPAVEGKLTTIGANAGFTVSGGKTYTVTNPTNSFTNSGLVRVTGTGSQITIGAGINLTNYNIGTQTLTGGVFEVLNGGALNLGTRTTNTIQTGTRVTLDGSTASFSVIEGGLLTTLSGQLSVSNGKSLTIAATGLTITNGGVLSGHLGTITGGTVRVTSSGTIAPGNSPGQITIGGGLDVGGTLELDISQGGGTNNSNGTGNTTPGLGFDTIIHQAPPGTNVTLRTNTSFRLLTSDTNLASQFWSVSQGWLFLRTTNGAIQFSNGAAGDPVSPLSQIPTANVSLINSANGQPIDYIAQWPNSSFLIELSSFESGQSLTLVWHPVPEPKNLIVAFFVMFGVWLTFRSRESAFKKTNVWRSEKTLPCCFSLSLSPKSTSLA